MADIQHNLKTGADSDVYFSREVTNNKSSDFGKLISRKGVFKFPYLSRTTGNSIKGTTDTIESNELRKGRTKSAPRKGNASTDGSIDIELSPITFDDNLAAAFRNEWKRWRSDTRSAINLDEDSFADGFFKTKSTGDGAGYNETFGKRRLINDGSAATADGLISCAKGCVVDELTCGTEDIKYSVLKKFGGITGEDLYQEFKHMAVNSLSLDVQIGAIVTGSFEFMGTDDPRMMKDDEIRANFGGTSTDRFEDKKTTGESFVNDLPSKSTSTDQFTSREGNLWVNGKNVTFAQSLSFSLNNGLEKKFAIFVKNAISTQPLSLEISGELKTYLVHGSSDDLFNLSVDDKDIEILFCFQDKETNPEALYVFQIFKNKFGTHDTSSSGADTFDVTLPYTSFEELAVRCFRIALPKVSSVELEQDKGTATKIVVYPNVPVEKGDVADFSISAELSTTVGDATTDEALTLKEAVYVDGRIEVELDSPVNFEDEKSKMINVSVVMNADTTDKAFEVLEAEAPASVTDLKVEGKSKKAVVTWTDSTSDDADSVIIDVTDNTGTSVATGSVAKGTKTYTVTGLSNGAEYTISVKVKDVHGNFSDAVKGTVTPASVGRVSGASATADSTTATITWSDPGADFANVVITDKDGNVVTIVAKGTETATVTGLTADTEYTFDIKCVNAGGTSGDEVAVTVKTSV